MDDDSPPTRRRRNRASQQNANNDVSLSQKTRKKGNTSSSQTRENLSQPQASTSRENMFGSQLSQSQRASQNHDMVMDFDEAEAVSRTVRYLLTADRTKHAIQRNNIVKYALGGSSKNYKNILRQAENYLKQIFGYKLVEYEGNKYILCNNLENPLLYTYYSKQEKSQLVLLFIVLSHIFMNGGSCREENLWDFFKLLGIATDDDVEDDYFGNVKHLVTTDFVKQLYLDQIKIPEEDCVKVEYRWGPRAEEEVSPRKVLELVTKYFGKTDISHFEVQYRAMQLMEKNSQKNTTTVQNTIN